MPRDHTAHHERRLEVREIAGDDLRRANSIYRNIEFATSKPPRDRTFGAFRADELVGLARINDYEDALELGGFWTHPEHRGHGVAKTLLRYVLGELPVDRACYCVPFASLADFYRRHGMQDVAPDHDVPASIRTKLEFCRDQESAGRYGATVLLQLQRP